jgi:hypothetical protein
MQRSVAAFTGRKKRASRAKDKMPNCHHVLDRFVKSEIVFATGTTGTSTVARCLIQSYISDMLINVQ